MQFQPPVDESVATSGIVFFARMLDKIRLHAAGRLGPGYLRGMTEPTCFDARFCSFWGLDYAEVEARTLEGGSDEEVLAWCFRDRGFPDEHEILQWNTRLLKRAWFESSTMEPVLELAEKG
jgi:gluconokinase